VTWNRERWFWYAAVATAVVLGVAFVVVVQISVRKCEATGGELLKTISGRYVCVHDKAARCPE